jgi:predicted DNA-binding transcriptional regulator AlpA
MQIMTRSADDDQMISFREWCGLNDISESTGRRLIASGQAPRFVRISEKRISVTRGENRRWRQSRQVESAA